MLLLVGQIYLTQRDCLVSIWGQGYRVWELEKHFLLCYFAPLLSLNEHAFTPVNGDPEILCATEEDVYATLELGIKLAINTDAHHVDQFDLLHYGIATAQCGWATAVSVVNSWSLEKFMAYLQR